MKIITWGESDSYLEATRVTKDFLQEHNWDTREVSDHSWHVIEEDDVEPFKSFLKLVFGISDEHVNRVILADALIDHWELRKLLTMKGYIKDEHN